MKKLNNKILNSPLLRIALIDFIKKEGRYLDDIRKYLNITQEDVKNLIISLSSAGYPIKKNGNFIKLEGEIFATSKAIKINPKTIYGDNFEFGIVSDSHLGSFTERLDVLEAAYDDFAKSGIKTVYHLGNIVEGEGPCNKFDIKVHGIVDQALYCIHNYPQRSGITTQFITADDHEGWWFQREGIDFGRYLYLEASKRGRKDLIHLGYQEVNIQLKAARGSAMMRLTHPGKGTAYADSYAAQKQVESYQGGEKPDILLIGHYHKLGFWYPREVFTVLCGCTSDQSRFMRKKNLAAHVGYLKIKYSQNHLGIITDFSPTFKRFFDSTYYKRVSKGV